MAKFLHADVLDGGLNGIKTVAIRMLLLSKYVVNDSYATVIANALNAGVVMATGDFTLGTAVLARNLTTGTKSQAASASSAADITGTATAGGAATLTDSGKSWTVNAQAGRKVVIESGTGSGQTGEIISNTATVLTIAANWATPPDATSVYRIKDNLHFAFTDGSAKVLWVTDETTDQAVTSGNTINFPALVCTFNQPV